MLTRRTLPQPLQAKPLELKLSLATTKKMLKSPSTKLVQKPTLLLLLLTNNGNNGNNGNNAAVENQENVEVTINQNGNESQPEQQSSTTVTTTIAQPAANQANEADAEVTINQNGNQETQQAIIVQQQVESQPEEQQVVTVAVPAVQSLQQRPGST